MMWLQHPPTSEDAHVVYVSAHPCTRELASLYSVLAIQLMAVQSSMQPKLPVCTTQSLPAYQHNTLSDVKHKSNRTHRCGTLLLTQLMWKHQLAEAV